jgi:hypothetical protein
MGANDGKKKTSHLPTIEDEHLKQSPLYYHFFSETWDRFSLSQLVTPTQALRCKEIQYSPLSAGRRAFFYPNQDKPPCTLLASPSRLGTRNIDSLVGLGPSQDQTPTHVNFVRFRMNLTFASQPFRVINKCMNYRYAKFQNFSRYASLYFKLVSM